MFYVGYDLYHLKWNHCLLKIIFVCKDICTQGYSYLFRELEEGVKMLQYLVSVEKRKVNDEFQYVFTLREVD